MKESSWKKGCKGIDECLEGRISKGEYICLNSYNLPEHKPWIPDLRVRQSQWIQN